jgi:hypothetical protein
VEGIYVVSQISMGFGSKQLQTYLVSNIVYVEFLIPWLFL